MKFCCCFFKAPMSWKCRWMMILKKQKLTLCNLIFLFCHLYFFIHCNHDTLLVGSRVNHWQWKIKCYFKRLTVSADCVSIPDVKHKCCSLLLTSSESCVTPTRGAAALPQHRSPGGASGLFLLWMPGSSKSNLAPTHSDWGFMLQPSKMPDDLLQIHLYLSHALSYVLISNLY